MKLSITCMQDEVYEAWSSSRYPVDHDDLLFAGAVHPARFAQNLADPGSVDALFFPCDALYFLRFLHPLGCSHVKEPL